MDSNRHGDWPLECKVYIGDLGEDATRHEIEDCFAKFGPVRNIWVAKRPPGFAFVLMDDPRDAEDATKELDGTRMCGKRVKTSLYPPAAPLRGPQAPTFTRLPCLSCRAHKLPYPSLPPLKPPTALPGLPTALPGLPTALPGLPTAPATCR